jgi:hypothetical protein
MTSALRLAIQTTDSPACPAITKSICIFVSKRTTYHNSTAIDVLWLPKHG